MRRRHGTKIEYRCAPVIVLIESGVLFGELEQRFFSARRRRELVAIGALQKLDETRAELKSMHTAEGSREQGVGRAMLEALIAVARRQRYRQVSLETGTMDAFTPARSLYLSAGFVPCGPFGDYRPSPNSMFMTLTLE